MFVGAGVVVVTACVVDVVVVAPVAAEPIATEAAKPPAARSPMAIVLSVRMMGSYPGSDRSYTMTWSFYETLTGCHPIPS